MKLKEIPRTNEPARIVTLPPGAFADAWANKPKEDVAIGLRLIPHAEVDRAKREAEREATGYYDEGTADTESVVDAYNDSLLVQLVARATTDPNDSSVPYFGDAPDDLARLALTSAGLRTLWNEIARMHAELSPTVEPATDAQIAMLGKALARGVGVSSMSVEARKVLAWCLCQIADQIPADIDDDEESDDDESPYLVMASS